MTRNHRLMIVTCIVAFTACSDFALSEPATGGPIDKVGKWEYKFEIYSIDLAVHKEQPPGLSINKRLNVLADQGWELVETTCRDSGQNFCGFVYKRAKVGDNR